LVKFTAAQATHAAAIEFGERCEKHCVDWHIDADAERVGAANHGKEAALGKLFHEQAIARQHAGVMYADPAGEQVLENLAEGRGEARPFASVFYGCALFFACDAIACESLCGMQR
jgi:hypothetical protein